MSGLIWKLNRFRAMRSEEIVYRLHNTLQARWEKMGLGLARYTAPDDTLGFPWVEHLASVLEKEPYRTAADCILAGTYDIFTLHGENLGFPPVWNQDPKTGTLAPLVFGKTLNYRDECLVGDIKYLWELNRHLELVTLAQAWHLTRESRYSQGFRALLDSWFEQCPYPLGVNWNSSLEHGVRLVNWAVAWHLLDGASILNGAFCRRWLDSVYRHCHFIAGHLSRHSSANNHLLGELMGLFIGSITWPCWSESADWRQRAHAEFEAAALKQTGPDGVNREQGIWYHHEVTDMMILVGLFGRRNGVVFSREYWQRLEKMLDFIAVAMDVCGHVPMIGDSDDAVMVRFSREPEFDVYRSLLATGAVLFGRSDFAVKAGRFDDKSRWLLGDVAAEKFAGLQSDQKREPQRNREQPRAFPEGGYYILAADLEMGNEIRLVADAGPLGYLSIAAHGHADALAFTLSASGRELLIDPGTYAYHTQRKWRDYFKGTSAHNTVRVDGFDQSVSGGNFLWIRHARARCERWEPGQDRDFFVGSHDGYLRLKDPVTHRRLIELDKNERRVRVLDTLVCKGEHKIELFWHFAEDCKVDVLGRQVVAYNGKVGMSMVMTDSRLVPKLIEGCVSPPLGWISRRFDEKVPCPTVRWVADIHGTIELETTILLADECR
jgi:hypothetical protein